VGSSVADGGSLLITPPEVGQDDSSASDLGAAVLWAMAHGPRPMTHGTWESCQRGGEREVMRGEVSVGRETRLDGGRKGRWVWA
jgi:hypothetical protein